MAQVVACLEIFDTNLFHYTQSITWESPVVQQLSEPKFYIRMVPGRTPAGYVIAWYPHGRFLHFDLCEKFLQTKFPKCSIFTNVPNQHLIFNLPDNPIHERLVLENTEYTIPPLHPALHRTDLPKLTHSASEITAVVYDPDNSFYDYHPFERDYTGVVFGIGKVDEFPITIMASTYTTSSSVLLVWHFSAYVGDTLMAEEYFKKVLPHATQYAHPSEYQ